MPEMISMLNDAPTAPNGKKLACLQIASALRAASDLFFASLSTRCCKTRPLSSKDTSAVSAPAPGMQIDCRVAGSAAKKRASFIAIRKQTAYGTPIIH